MINNDIFNIFSFSTFSFRYFTNPEFWLNFKKIALKTRSQKYSRENLEIFLGVSHMINNNIFNIFCFLTFSLGYFTNPAFWLNFKKIALKTGLRKYPREKVEKQKMLKMLLLIICETPRKKFKFFLAIFGHFTLFHFPNLL